MLGFEINQARARVSATLFFCRGLMPLKSSKLKPHRLRHRRVQSADVFNYFEFFMWVAHGTGREVELERQRLVPIFPKLKMQFRRSEFAVLCASNYFVYIIHPLTQSPLQVCNTTQGELRNKKTFSCNSQSPPKRILILFFQSHSDVASKKTVLPNGP